MASIDFYRKLSEPSKVTCNKCRRSSASLARTSFYFSLCSHIFCTHCLKRMFDMETTATCPVCSLKFGQSDLVEDALDRAEGQREMKIRRQLKKEAYLQRHNFPNTPGYYEFQERFEDAVESIMQRRDLDETFEWLAQLSRQGATSISENLAAEALNMHDVEEEEQDRLGGGKKKEGGIEEKRESVDLVIPGQGQFTSFELPACSESLREAAKRSEARRRSLTKEEQMAQKKVEKLAGGFKNEWFPAFVMSVCLSSL